MFFIDQMNRFAVPGSGALGQFTQSIFYLILSNPLMVLTMLPVI